MHFLVKIRYLVAAAGIVYLLSPPNLQADPPPNLQGDPLRRLRFIMTAGAGAQSRASRTEYKTNRERNFPGALVEVWDNPIREPALIKTREEVLRQIQEADIFMFSGHSNAEWVPGRQVLKVRPTNTPNEFLPGYVTASHIRNALHGRRGPRLVIINGCNTMNPSDGVPAEHRIINGFGIVNSMEGRAYLGWDMSIVGFTCDDHIGTLLTHWTTPDTNGIYPTLLQSKNHVNHPNLKLIGDPNLKYNVPFLLRSAAPQPNNNAHPMRLLWRPTGANTAQAVIEFGADDVRELRKFGLPGRLTLAATRTANGFEIRDPQFQRLVHKVCESLATTFANLVPGDRPVQPTIQIHEATLQVRGDGDNLRVTVKIRATATVPRPNQGPARQEILNGTFELIATPQTRPQAPPA